MTRPWCLTFPTAKPSGEQRGPSMFSGHSSHHDDDDGDGDDNYNSVDQDNDTLWSLAIGPDRK